MRWLFLILLGSNLALLVWFQQEQAQRAQVSERGELAGVAAENLLLLSELEVHLRPRVDNATPAPPVSPDLPASAAPGGSDSDEIAGAISGAVGSGAGESLEVDAGPLRCYSVYGFADGASAEDFIAQLPRGIQARVLPKMSSTEGYWVYVRSPKDPAQRQAVMERLQRQELEVSVIGRGELRGHLSLGHYQQYDLAYALFQALNAEGYEVDIHEVADMDPGYVVELVIADPAVSDQDWRLLLTASDQHLKNEKKSCEGVATKQGDE